MTTFSPERSGGIWSRGLRPSRALGLELARFGLALFLFLTLVFLFFQVWAGPFSPLLSPHDPKYAGIAAVDREIFALDQPVWTRYGVWLANVATGNLGLSYYYQEPVTHVFLQALPVTLELLSGAILWTLFFGLLLGWGSASRGHPLVAGWVHESASVLYGIPVLVAVIGLALWVTSAFGINLGEPNLGAYVQGALGRTTGFPILDRLLAGDVGGAGLEFGAVALLTLPTGLAFAMPVAHRVRDALMARRTGVVADGMPPVRGRLRSAPRSLVAPVAAAVAVLLPFLIGALVLTEILSGRRGVGFMLLQAVFNLDGPLVQGAAVLLGLIALAVGLPLALLGAGLARPASSLRRFGTPGGLMGHAPAGPRSAFAFLHRSRGATLVFVVGLALTVGMVGVALLGPVLAPYSPLQQVVPIGQVCTPQVDCPLSPPSSAHPLGVDFFGFDILSRVLSGGAALVGWVAFALAVAAGLGLALGLMPSALGRGADAVLRTALGAIAAIPILLLALLTEIVIGLGSVPVPLAVGLLFVPVLFRDARDLAARAVDPAPLRGRAPLRPGWIVNRAELGLEAAVPGFLARLPRRAAEIALVLESLTVLGFASPAVVDWGSEVAGALNSNVLATGNLGALYLPAILLTLLVVGWLLLSDGLRGMLEAGSSETSTGPAPPSLVPEANP